MESQDTSQNEVMFSSIPSFSQTSLDGPSFLNSQTNFFENAGILSRSAGEMIAEMTQVWIDERNAPEILPYEHSLVEPLIEAIESQTEKIIEDMENNTTNSFESMVYQTEVERIKYLLKSYLRVRLFKIEKLTLYILRQPNLREILSPQEIDYARRYQELVESHNHKTFLHQLPRSQHKQDEVFVDMSMVVEPNLNAPVFCQILDNIGHVEIDGDNVLFELRDIYILRYNDIRSYLREKKVKLI
ncbi:uncharacterized protein BX663DRAFT_501044 [Cokeromyces recurvatus]|uniref:uncharacterized protein n=1 Tax=Cokeromyces recurvatus TaxID=90255 RepID=UPI00222004B7|nr:uncharacterized protein BX663DRAFT_501044 [Cokeromyces recurvatus]KAI7904921.1 hypothetical protein BX663DRAFT_501044 [Cokeromyces recurvatus]